MTANTRTLRTYLVECFVPGIEESSLEAVGRAAEAAASAMTAAGHAIAFGGVTFVPEDEVVFLHFSAATADDVRVATTGLPIAAARIVESIAVTPDVEPPAWRDQG